MLISSRLCVRLAILAVASTWGCRADERAMPSAPNPPEPPAAWPVWDDSPVQTDSLVYTLRRLPRELRAFVRARYTNRTGAPVYFHRCTDDYDTPTFWFFRVGADSTRRFFVDWMWPCVGGVPLGVIQPGEYITVTAMFGSFEQPYMTPPLLPEHLVGRLRIYMSLCTRPAETEPCVILPFNERLTNAFEIRY